MYVKILVGTHTGKTLYAVSSLNDEFDTILVNIRGMHYEYTNGEYEIINIYGGK